MRLNAPNASFGALSAPKASFGAPSPAELQQVQFAGRQDLLKARSALLALDRIVQADGDARGLGGQVERLLAGAHEFAELRLLGALRSGTVALPGPLSQEAERLLGDGGGSATHRLGLPANAAPEEVRRAALNALRRWQGQAENPLFGRRVADACRLIARTCEGILANIQLNRVGTPLVYLPGGTTAQLPVAVEGEVSWRNPDR